MKKGGILLLGGLLVMLYARFDPAMHAFFPSCPFYSLTHLLCPGCGSQRAMHHLLNLQLVPAFQHNALMVLSIPYVLLGLALDRLKHPSGVCLKWRRILYGKKAILLILCIILLFSIFRNL